MIGVERKREREKMKLWNVMICNCCCWNMDEDVIEKDMEYGIEESVIKGLFICGYFFC